MCIIEKFYTNCTKPCDRKLWSESEFCCSVGFTYLVSLHLALMEVIAGGFTGRLVVSLTPSIGALCLRVLAESLAGALFFSDCDNFSCEYTVKAQNSIKISKNHILFDKQLKCAFEIGVLIKTT